MTETEREAWAALEAGIVEDAVAAGLLKELQRMWAEHAIHAYEKRPMQIEQAPYSRETPYRCPNCDGTGERVYPASPKATTSTILYPQPQQCHSCQGKGVLWR